MRSLLVLSAIAGALAGCAQDEQLPIAAIPACDPRTVVVSFYEEALIGLKPRKGFERWARPDFIEHKPDVPQGSREQTILYLEELIASVPQPQWEVLRTVVEGDMVFVHARFSPAAGAPPYAIADLFRLEDCLIAEHWDVVAAPVANPVNPNPRF